MHLELASGDAMIAAHPILGIGLDRFKADSLQYNPAIYSVSKSVYIAHDTYIQIAAEEGLPHACPLCSHDGGGIRNLSAVRRTGPPTLAALACAMQIVNAELICHFFAELICHFFFDARCPSFNDFASCLSPRSTTGGGVCLPRAAKRPVSSPPAAARGICFGCRA